MLFEKYFFFLYAIDIHGFMQGGARLSSQAAEAVPKEVDLKDENLAFVAGATGRVGSRTVRLLSTAQLSI